MIPLCSKFTMRNTKFSVLKLNYKFSKMEIGEEYRSSLSDLTVNSKPLITMLTMLAEENKNYADVIVKVIEEHIKKCQGPQKLPSLYLLDSIIKNVGGDYTRYFALSIINLFSDVFLKNEEKIRKKLYELRLTWNNVFPKSRLYMLDVTIQNHDPAWPIGIAPTGSNVQPTGKIFINPNLIKGGSLKDMKSKKTLTPMELKKKGEELFHEKKELEKMKKEEELIQKEKKKLEMMKATQKIKSDKVLKESPTESGVKKGDLKRGQKDNRDPRLSSSSKMPPLQSLSESSKSRDPRLAHSREESGLVDTRVKTSSKTPVATVLPLAVSTPKTRSNLIETNKQNKDSQKRDFDHTLSVNKLSDSSSTSQQLSTKVNLEKDIKNRTNLDLKSTSQNKNSTKNEEKNIKTLHENKSPKTSESSTATTKLSDIRSSASPNKLTERIDDSTEEVTSSKEMFQSLNEQDSESDDSDHYEGNKPPQLGIPKKDIKINDMDLRAKLPTETTQITEPADPVVSTSLFGKEDVDLRKISAIPPAGGFVLPPVEIPAAFQAPSIVKPAQTQEIPRGNFEMHESMSKLTVNTSNSASWEKFREKNPEFQKYQRAASIADSESSYMELDDSRPPSRRSTFYDKEDFTDDDFESMIEEESQDIDSHSENMRKNYHAIIKEAEEQLRRHEITFSQYRQLLSTVVQLKEQDKIKQAKRQEKVKNREGATQRNIPSPFSRFKKTDKSPNRPEAIKNDIFPYKRREDKWPQSRRGRGNAFIKRSLPLPNQLMDNISSGESDFEDEYTNEPDLPSVPEAILHKVDKEPCTRTIDIDQTPREIRTYGETAIVLISFDEPRLIKFESGHCKIVFDEGKFILPMSVEDDYKEFTIDGETHRIKLGSPTQELIIDGKGYQCFFGGKPISVHLAGINRTIHLEGNPPKVAFGEKNYDFIAGKVQMIINAKKGISLYLDPRPQRFHIDGKPFILKFADNLQSVIINTVKFKVEFDGMPLCISVRGRKKFLAFSALPPGVVPGKVNIFGMDSPDLVPDYSNCKPSNTSVPTMLQPPPLPPNMLRISDSSPMPRPPIPPPPPFNPHIMPQRPMPPPFMHPPPFPTMGFSRPGMRPPLHPMPSHPITLPSMNLPLHSPSLRPPPPFMHPPDPNITPGSYTASNVDRVPPPPPKTPIPMPTEPTNNEIDVNFLLDSLYRTGILSSKSSSNSPPIQVEEIEEEIEELPDPEDLKHTFEDMMKSENLKMRSKRRIGYLYVGMQCTTCGERFATDRTIEFSSHLEWHYRREKRLNKIRNFISRRMFYEVQDWLHYGTETLLPINAPISGTDDFAEEEEDEAIVPVNSDNPSLGVCPSCHETFYQFLDKESNLWFYKNAVTIDSKNYHPSCYNEKSIGEEIKKIRRTTSDDDITQLVVPPKILPIIQLDDSEPIKSEYKLVQSEKTNTSDLTDIISLTHIKKEKKSTKLKIKTEIKSEPMDEDIIQLEGTTPAMRVSSITTVVSSSMDGNLELAANIENIRKETTPKIKISINSKSKEKETSNQDDEGMSNGIDDKSTTEDPPTKEPDFIPPPFSVDLSKKPCFKDVTLKDQTRICQGFETSGLCNIM